MSIQSTAKNLTSKCVDCENPVVRKSMNGPIPSRCSDCKKRNYNKNHGQRRRDRYRNDQEYRNRELARVKKPELKQAHIECVLRYRQSHRFELCVRRALVRGIKRGIECDKEFLFELAKTKPTNCPCCDKEFDLVHGGLSGPSLDRVMPSAGYVRGNVKIICWRCNILKRDGVLREFENIVSYLKKRSEAT